MSIDTGNKIASVQALRGIAASLVCLAHLASGSDSYLAALSPLRDSAHLGIYGVQIFFVISGFVLPYSLFRSQYSVNRFGTFFARRVVRIEPPYILSIAVVIVLAWVSTLSPYYRGQGFSVVWSDVLFHLGYLNSFLDRPWLSPVYWTLAIEFQFYFLLGLLFGVFRSSGFFIQASIVCIFLVLSILIPNEGLVFRQAPFFLVGIFTFFVFERFIPAQQFWIYAIAFTIVGAFSTDAKAAVFAIATVPAILFWRSPSRALLFVGTISYSLYLVHVPVGTRVTNLTEALTQNTAIRLAMVAVAYAASIFAAYVFYRIIEVPAIGWSKKIRMRKASVVNNA